MEKELSVPGLSKNTATCTSQLEICLEKKEILDPKQQSLLRRLLTKERSSLYAHQS